MNVTPARVALVPDRWLLLAACLLAPAGLLITRAVSLEDTPRGLDGDVLRQAAYLAASLAAMTAVSRLDYRLLRTLAPQIFALALLALLVVLVLGSHQYGARRWIGVGGFTVQPSEFAKLAVVIAGAAFAADREPGGRTAFASLALFGATIALVVVEPDLGTGIVLGLAWVAIATTWGVSWRFVGTLAVLGLSLFPLTLAVAVPDYQRERLAVFLDPGRDPLGSGFTLRQVEVAFGTGGLTGRGFGGASSALEGVATRTSDFAFAQLGEFAGAAGTIAVIALFAVIAWRGYGVAARAPDRFGRLLATGLTTVIVLQAAMHIAVNLRLFPATGIPLPFISAGGSALLVTFVAVGVLESIAAHRLPGPRESGRAFPG